MSQVARDPKLSQARIFSSEYISPKAPLELLSFYTYYTLCVPTEGKTEFYCLQDIVCRN